MHGIERTLRRLLPSCFSSPPRFLVAVPSDAPDAPAAAAAAPSPKKSRAVDTAAPAPPPLAPMRLGAGLFLKRAPPRSTAKGSDMLLASSAVLDDEKCNDDHTDTCRATSTHRKVGNFVSRLHPASFLHQRERWRERRRVSCSAWTALRRPNSHARATLASLHITEYTRAELH
jgi:hypothetical protein